jgi:two-component system response regulator AgrA
MPTARNRTASEPALQIHASRKEPSTMLDIYICEDDKTQLDLFSNYISNTILIEDFDMRLALSTQDYHELLELFSPSGNIGVFFLDIDLKSDIDGLKLAQRIRKLQPRCFIIFITSHAECGMETFRYKVEALDFICKGDPGEIRTRIKDCLYNIDEKIRSDPKSFHFNIGERHVSIPFDEIVCFQTSDNSHKVTVHTMNRLSEFFSSLKEIEAGLDKRFYRCHRSCIVNKDFIDTVNYDQFTVHMKNGMECPISLRLKGGLKRLLR